jgi:uncharacterized protein YyaL (SSP411 family)
LSEPAPGAPPYDDPLRKDLDDALAAKGRDYRARTRHKRSDGQPRFTNRLVLETSPYLLQHAHNPVDWHPWGDDAFALAKELDRPVFLSVGYSTCHWCHVMEEESFEDEEIAAYINANYVPIKLDREERPDVDGIYMTAVQAVTGHGGWPMSVWLTPAREPFFAGTYFPARDGDRGTSSGFLTILRRLRRAWDEEQDEIERSSRSVADAVRRELTTSRAGDLATAETLERAMSTYEARFDSTHGGLRVRQKFPSQLSIRFLLRQHARGREGAQEMATLTLDKMAASGMYDHVGGGFHRYATDARWLVPHFEKMLYDNALLATAYLEAWQLTGDDEYANVARETLGWIERDMTSPEGAFYSATDADSLAPDGHREEGWFFTWTPEELVAELGTPRAGYVMAAWGVTDRGNFEGRSILHRPRPLEETARGLELEPEALARELDEARAVLYEARKERPAPLRDEKILAAWNGLAISAAAQAGWMLDEPRFTRLAERAADFVLDHMRDGDRLKRTHKDGAARHDAVLDDYAFVCAGLIDLFEATGEPRWLDEAKALDAVLAASFESAEGAFHLVPDDRDDLLVREVPAYDGAEPSGSSVHALSLLRLGALTSEPDYRERALRCVRGLGQVLTETPTALSELLLAVDWLVGDPREIVLLAPDGRAATTPLLDVVRTRFVPNKVVVAGPPSLADATPLARDRTPDAATAWVCREGACELPTADPDKLAELLSAAS